MKSAAPLDSVRTSLLHTALRMTAGAAALALSPHALPADILRGGAAAGTVPAAAGSAASGQATPAATNQARTNAQDTLARTTQALATVKALQDAARKNAAQGGNSAGVNPRTGAPLPTVPNGLGTGGLQIDPRVTSSNSTWWQGADLPVQSTTGDQTQVTVRQTAQQAVLNWETFNVGKNTTLTFDQSGGGSNASQWIAFNKVNDPSGNPTQILGSIKAQGQVYVINRNGIIFGGSSQVNVNTLTASALPINDSLVAGGLLNNPSSQFLFDGLGKGAIGDVTVQAGAKISSPVSADGNGGRVMLVGANVTNDGTISTPAGQTILAAGLQVGVAAHASSDPSLRGLDVYVGAISDPASALQPYAGTATNRGLIEAFRAGVTITGKEVQQLGLIDSSTSVSLNGRIDLLANYGAVANAHYDANGQQGLPFLFQSAGAVTLGSGSTTRILPEYSSKDQAVGSELALRSQINLQGQSIHLASGSILLAPNAKTSLRAGRWAALSSTPYASFISDGGQVYIDSGAEINLAGTLNAQASVLQNYLTLVLRGSELAVAPLQRDGELRGDTITVDVTQSGTYNGRDWVGTPLADVSGFVALIQRDVSQLTTAGGTLDISAGGSVVVRDGATLDVSGGSTAFSGAIVHTTQLWSSGQLIDIADATPDRVYDGIFGSTSTVSHSKWGVTESFARSIAPTGQSYQAGYVQGANAGTISISSPAMALDGNLVATTVTGPRQTRSNPATSNLPQAGTLTLKFQSQILANNAILSNYPNQPDVVFDDPQAQEDPGDFALDASGAPVALPASRRETVHLSSALTYSSGFGNLTIENAEGNILIPDSTTLNLRPGASLSLTAANVSVLGDIIAPGATLSFKALNISPYEAAPLASDASVPAAHAGKGVFTLGSGAVIDTRGLVLDDRPASMTANGLPAIIHGGKVTIAGYDVDLQAGSAIDVSGGYLMKSSGKGQYGKAGSISIKAGQDPTVAAVLGGTLDLGASLRGFSGAGSGTLAVQAQHVQIGGSSSVSDALLLASDFFSQGGFGSFQISGLGGGEDPALRVADGAVIAPVVKTYQVIPNPEGGGPLQLQVIEDVAGVRPAASLTLSAPGVRDLSGNALFARGDVILGEGSVILTDAGGSVAVNGNTVSVLGSIITPGGTISVAGGSSSSLVFNDTTQARTTTWLGEHAVLSAAGTTVLLPDAYGRRIGSVLAGGNVTLGGNIATSSGAVIDVSGTSGVLDLDPGKTVAVRGSFISPTSGVTGSPQTISYVPTRIDSNGGTITLKGGQILASDATLLANAGGANALGGTLNVSSGRFDPPGIIPPASAITLTVRQSGLVAGSASGIGSTAGNGGLFSLDRFSQGGFDSLTLGGNVSLEGEIDLTARAALRIATDGFLYANGDASLTASYAAIGRPLAAPALPAEATSPYGSATFAPTFGSGKVEIDAAQIDVGTLSLQNIGQLTLSAPTGDIRGSGSLHLAGDLILRAGQIYPTTASSLSFIAYDYQEGGTTHQGSIRIEAGQSRQFPLSSGGALGIYASVIHQDGVLRAPFGSIQLGWDGTGPAPVDLIAGGSKAFPVTSQLTLGAGSITSVSAVDPATGKGITIPYGVSTNGENWIDPRGVDITTSGPPHASVVLSAGSVTTEKGSSIDLRGGGDLYADRFVSGLGGPSDILASGNSYAILPGYASNFAPVSEYNASTSAANLIAGSDGYSSSTLQPGDRIYLAGSATLPAGYYTLLPARYALLPGAVLITPSSGNGAGTVEMPDKSSVVSGYRYNSLNPDRTLSTVSTRFEVASSAVVRKRAEYENYLANTFFKKTASATDGSRPRLPVDSGHLVFQATQAMDLLGAVASNSIAGGRGSVVDISTPLDTYVGSSSSSAPAGAIALDAATLNSFGAESLLVGGRRVTTADGVSVEVRSSRVTIDNAGAPLSAADLVLVASNGITVADGATLSSTGNAAPSDVLHLTGNGALLRVSSDASASIVRTGATAGGSVLVSIAHGAKLQGQSLTLDSTSQLVIDPGAALLAKAYSLNSGRIALVLDEAAAPADSSSLLLSQSLLDDLGAAASLSLLSYSSIDLYGDGVFGSASLAKLALSAGEIRGDGNATLSADELLLQNTAKATASSPAAPGNGTLTFQTGVTRLGANDLTLSGYAQVNLSATQGIIGEGSGNLITQGSLTLTAPRLLGAAGAKRGIIAGGDLQLLSTTQNGTAPTGGLGSSLSLSGASVDLGSDIVLPSGSLAIHATSGDLTVRGLLDASGSRQVFQDATKYTRGGSVSLSSDHGGVVLTSSSRVNLSAPPGGGDAGSLTVAVPQGSFQTDGAISAAGGQGGADGRFTLDIAALPHLSSLAAVLTASHLTESQTLRVRTGDVELDGLTRAHDFHLAADSGSIAVTGTVDASGATGGSIELAAHGDVVTASGSRLSVRGQDFNSAGKGGSITLSAGSQTDGVVGSGQVAIRSGSVLDLSVAKKIAGDAITPGTSAYQGQFSGQLHLGAPRLGITDLAVAEIAGSVIDPSSILVEGYKLYDLTPTGSSTNAEITAATQTAIKNDASAFLGASGTASSSYAAIAGRLLVSNPSLEPLLVIAPGAEIINRRGDLSLGASGSTTTSDWDLSTFRFGPKAAPGVLTLRAAGNLVFNNALSDGFTPTLPNTNASWLWTARLAAQNAALPINAQSWSYHLAAGSDFFAADLSQVKALADLTSDTGYVKIGKTGAATGTTTAAALANRLQFIRTGSGDIEVSAASSVQLLNAFATIYTAGTRVANPTLDGTFGLPRLYQSIDSIPSILGAVQQVYPAQYSMAGGDVTVTVGRNIEHLTLSGGQLVADSQLELPSNWLYRRGYVDAATGQFGNSPYGESASTTWWVDFSNFFEGIGALGGGNVTLTAGNNVSNVDAVAATNARMPGGTPSAAKLLELGGGDVTVIAGNNIDAGVYYVERGQGSLSAGGSIVTNATRSVLNQSNIDAGNASAQTQLPTTLFLGKGGWDVGASGDVLLGPVANLFLLPGGFNNTSYYKTWFSTYAAADSVSVTSLGGDVTLRTAVTGPATDTLSSATPILSEYYRNKLLLSSTSASSNRPWLRLNETDVSPFATLFGLMPGSLDVAALSGDIRIAGDITLSPSATGTLNLLASGSIAGLQPNGKVKNKGVSTTTWGASTVIVSDADPLAIPSVSSPLAYQALAPGSSVTDTSLDFLQSIDVLFAESGGTLGESSVLQRKQALHASGLLHRDDPEPLRLYASSGDISGLTLFSPKAARILAGRDIQDIAFYIQNVRASDASIVASGRDLIPSTTGSLLRIAAQAAANGLNLDSGPLAGDIQISGPGSLQVLAGRTLDLGAGASSADGTGAGITSIGNARNPFLPYEGADLVVAAGLGSSAGLSSSALHLQDFITAYVTTADGAKYLKEIAPGIVFADQPVEEQARLALEVFYRILRDAGRGHAESGNYDTALDAIKVLFGSGDDAPAWSGELLARARDIRTTNGGEISILAPGGGVTLASTAIGNPLSPPGIITSGGGNISVFARDSIDIGIGRIFTLRGGNEIIWSTQGDIAAGSSSKTVQSAPPTRVLIDPQSASVQTDLSGLATGGGIGVLATVKGVVPGNVDLIAPEGTVDAGDAGIRVSGNLNIAAAQVLNFANISVTGSSAGTPAAPAAPSVSAVNNPTQTGAASDVVKKQETPPAQETAPLPDLQPPDSIITVEVIGYGGEDSDVQESEEEKKRPSRVSENEAPSPSPDPSGP